MRNLGNLINLSTGRSFLWLTLGFGVCTTNTSLAEEFSFDVSAYQKAPYELYGHFDLLSSHQQIDSNSAFSQMTFDRPVNSVNSLASELELNGLYRWEQSSAYFRSLSLGTKNDLPNHFLNANSQSQHQFQELYWQTQLNSNWQFKAGKIAEKWGKGYAWNPVGFIERPKNPDDPELNREGFTQLSTQWTKSLNSSLQSASASIHLIPITSEINHTEFLPSKNWLLAGKFSGLIGTTDLDFYWRHSQQTQTDIGFSFASNLSPQFEWHGDISYRPNQLTPELLTDTIKLSEKSEIQTLLGFRYLTQNDVTWIVEWRYQPNKPTPSTMKKLYQLANSTQPENLTLAKQAKSAGLLGTDTAHNSVYIKASTKDWLDILYLNAALWGLINPDDGSSAWTAELSHSGVKNQEWRLRASLLNGSKLTEYGEKLNDAKLELRWRYFFQPNF